MTSMWETEVDELFRQFAPTSMYSVELARVTVDDPEAEIARKELRGWNTPYRGLERLHVAEDTSSVSAERIESEKREQNLYGELLADVKFLRARDFTVSLDTVDPLTGLPTLLCDEKPITADELRAKAARERRLLDAAWKQLHAAWSAG
jgi:hypothetical protein